MSKIRQKKFKAGFGLGSNNTRCLDLNKLANRICRLGTGTPIVTQHPLSHYI